MNLTEARSRASPSVPSRPRSPWEMRGAARPSVPPDGRYKHDMGRISGGYGLLPSLLDVRCQMSTPGAIQVDFDGSTRAALHHGSLTWSRCRSRAAATPWCSTAVARRRASAPRVLPEPAPPRGAGLASSCATQQPWRSLLSRAALCGLAPHSVSRDARAGGARPRVTDVNAEAGRACRLRKRTLRALPRAANSKTAVNLHHTAQGCTRAYLSRVVQARRVGGAGWEYCPRTGTRARTQKRDYPAPLEDARPPADETVKLQVSERMLPWRFCCTISQMLP